MEFPFFAKNKTFRPKKKFEQGTMRFNLHKKAQASLNSGLDLKVVVKLPAEEDFNDWLAVHVVDFFNRINLIYGTVCEFCSAETCPIMSGGPRYEYMWMDGEKYRKPTALPATDYINNLMDWVEQLINNETIFPINTGDKTNYHFLDDLDVYGIFPQLRFGNDNLSITFTTDVSFPKSFVSTCKKILTRLHRVFVHVYIHHFDKLVEIGAEAHINTCYKHFYFFVTEFNLVDSKELEPLRDMIQKICI